ncbi:hypothetical protein PR048_018800 [Dryococelus australis]|uniref:Uncharacterized protein n=1 Tax=Dryococelus australis TaxID=614101 RepID=A0ABQ9H1R6_9NEOP|nr:hypothetical protein PR048_018800 [Dryococelus australis]
MWGSEEARQAAIEGLNLLLARRTFCNTVVHAGNEGGFVQNAALTFFCKKNTVDAHNEMTADGYEQLLPKTPEGAAVLSYHTIAGCVDIYS